MATPEEIMDFARGDCRVDPPKLVQIIESSSNAYGKTAWPRTQGNHWCGKFAERPDDHVTELPDSWEHVSEPASRVIEQACEVYSASPTTDEAA